MPQSANNWSKHVITVDVNTVCWRASESKPKSRLFIDNHEQISAARRTKKGILEVYTDSLNSLSRFVQCSSVKRIILLFMFGTDATL